MSPRTFKSAVNLSIPMPGHHISRDEMSKSVKTLEDLIKTHSVIYLLMDTRESRNLELFFTWIKTISFLYINCFIKAPSSHIFRATKIWNFSAREIRDLSRITHKSGRYETFGIVYIFFYKSIFNFDF